MSVKISQVPGGHDTAPAVTHKVELENAAGDTSIYSTLDEIVANAVSPTLTTVARDALSSPRTSKLIYNSTTTQLEFYDGTIWRNFAGEPSLSGANQIVGATPANTAEVEANAKATRITFRAEDVTDPDIGWRVAHYMMASSNSAYSTTNGISDGWVLQFANLGLATLVIPKKISVWAVNGAVTGARVGAVIANLYHVYGISPGTLPSFNYEPELAKLDTRSPAAQAAISISLGGALDTKEAIPLETITGSVTSSGGTNVFQGATLYDNYVAEQPLVLAGRQAVEVGFTWPAAVTSQTYFIFLNFEWTEWSPIIPAEH